MADVELTDDLDRFRADVSGWLADNITGPLADLRGRGGNGDEDTGFELREKWEQLLGVAGPGYELQDEQKLFLFSRADTIYGGSHEIQKTVIGERVLGLPKEPA